MFFDDIQYGTQYYRAPTPLENEWENDLSKMGEYGLDLIQIRINWRWNEKKENEYDFSDVDKLMELSQKYNKKVIIKFLLECAPQYVFDKYGGTRIDDKGGLIRGGSHGAFYGGWRPCFTNPKVQERATKFVETVAKRYSGYKNIVFWNVWNEIRNRPVSECYCEHCRKGFGKYLQEKFTKIENLNKFYGTAEESFESIALPAMAHGFWDAYEFKKYKGDYELKNWLKFVYDAIRKYDKARPIMSHVGISECLQNNLDDVCNDYSVSKAVDFFGTSVGCDSSMANAENRLEYFMLNDYMRLVDENYFIYEIYPGLGMFKWYDTEFDLKFKLYAGVASGAKGLMYWQYRAERLGNENDCAGLCRMNGEPREIMSEVKDFAKILKEDGKLFAKSKAKSGDIAIAFDFNSMLLSEIEDYVGKDFELRLKNEPLFNYKDTHTGAYRLLNNLDYTVDYLNVEKQLDCKDYKVLYFPYYTMLNKEIEDNLYEFLNKGGIVIADEGFGLRQENTWMQPYEIDLPKILKAQMKERRLIENESIVLSKEEIAVKPFKTTYKVENAKSVLKFKDGETAMHEITVGKGKLYLCGFSIGYSYLNGNGKTKTLLTKLVSKLLNGVSVTKNAYSNVKEDLYEKRLINEKENKQIVFLFNCSDEEKSVQIKEKVIKSTLQANSNSNVTILPPKSMGYLIVEN